MTEVIPYFTLYIKNFSLKKKFINIRKQKNQEKKFFVSKRQKTCISFVECDVIHGNESTGPVVAPHSLNYNLKKILFLAEDVRFLGFGGAKKEIASGNKFLFG
jgi:hypothetical protein